MWREPSNLEKILNVIKEYGKLARRVVLCNGTKSSKIHNWGPQGPSTRALLPELQRNKDTFGCVAFIGGTLLISPDGNLDCAFVENAHFTTDP